MSNIQKPDQTTQICFASFEQGLVTGKTVAAKDLELARHEGFQQAITCLDKLMQQAEQTVLDASKLIIFEDIIDFMKVELDHKSP